MKSLNIYLHIPFCFAKCPYCAFFSCTNAESTYEEYFNRLNKEIVNSSMMFSDRQVETIYIGGGTPNLVPEKYISKAIKSIRKSYKLRNNCEISIELYPQYISERNLEIYKEIGINRISIGLQSTHNEDLIILSRRYTYESFLEKYQLLKKYDFNNIGVDLIFGYPTHTLEKWEFSLSEISQLDIQHISAYSLEIEENSVYGKLDRENKLKLPTDGVNRKMCHITKRILESKQIYQYEISNYSKPGYECKHNLNFWNYQDYLGLGAGAYSRIEDRKYHNPENIEAYIKGEKIEVEEIGDEQISKEKQILGLRLNQGIPFNTETFNPLYMQRLGEYMSLNEYGRDLYNKVVEEIL